MKEKYYEVNLEHFGKVKVKKEVKKNIRGRKKKI